ncbi:MAG: ABC transporter permease [Actinomycetota bacterium]|nr:ABC transporter permease [Actinomycetota bacterium]
MSSETLEIVQVRPRTSAALTAFAALLVRDMTVLKKTFHQFILRTIMQPLLFVFVFTYVFPKIGQGIGGNAGGQGAFSSLLVPGVLAIASIFQGIQAVALPLVQEFGYTREIEDRMMAPLPIWGVALEKLVSGAVQGMIAALVVFPLANFIPATPVHLHIRWFVFVTVLPLSTFLGASLGLAIGTKVKPQQVPLIFSVVVIPITFLGATYYPWARLTPIPWLKYTVLINPLVYMSEAFRAAVTPQFPHMNLFAIYAGLIGFTALLASLGIQGFRSRVLT